MRHHEIAKVRGLYYDADQVLAVWEVGDVDRLDRFTHGQLWLAFERFLTTRFPDARRFLTDDAAPGTATEQNRAFLRDLGYRSVAGTHRFFAKEISRGLRQR